MKNLDICIIGGGSRLWAPTIMKDLARANDLTGTLRLYDIDQAAAKANEEVGNRLFQLYSTGPGFKVKAVTGVEEAISGSDFIILSIEPGPTEMRAIDLLLPQEYGIIQTVGDTTGPGGIFRAMRSIPLFRNYARLIAAHCPDAWVINYSNPMTWCTQTLTSEEPGLKVLGCCHEVFGTQKFIASMVSKWFGIDTPEHKEIQLDICGLNHFTFATSAVYKGLDLFSKIKELAEHAETYPDRSKMAAERREKEQWFTSDHLIALEFMKNFGNLGAAGDRHLAEFVPWYLKDEPTIMRYGVVPTPYQWRIKQAQEKRAKQYSDEELRPAKTDEEGVAIIRALSGLGSLYTNINMPNRGQIGWIPEGHVVETNAFIEQNLVVPSVAGVPGKALKALTSTIVEEQRLVLEAAFTDDIKILFEAFLMDPLVRISTDKARELFNLMLKKSREGGMVIS